MEILLNRQAAGYVIVGLLCILAGHIYLTQQREKVVAIDWQRFLDRAHDQSADEVIAKRLLQRSSCFALSWINSANNRDDRHSRYVLPGTDEDSVRTASSVAYGLATLLATRTYDHDLGCFTSTEAKKRTIEIIRGIISSHKTIMKNGWGQSWQSALWATYVGQAGWMLWGDLDSETRRHLHDIVVFEAAPFVHDGYRAPYWISKNGAVNFPGDTKAEENAWNAGILLLAMAMMPDSVNFGLWRNAANDLMISAFAFKDDMDSERRIDGKAVRDWVDGYNVRDDGAVENHNMIHPDYMTAPIISLRSYAIQPLAMQRPLESSTFNADRIYSALSNLGFYQEDSVEIRYPKTTDWSTHRVDVFYLFDLFADRLPLKGIDRDAVRKWKILRATKLNEMQGRSDKGQLYQPGEFDTWKVSEQYAMTLFADAFLFCWLTPHLQDSSF